MFEIKSKLKVFVACFIGMRVDYAANLIENGEILKQIFFNNLDLEVLFWYRALWLKGLQTLIIKINFYLVRNTLKNIMMDGQIYK